MAETLPAPAAGRTEPAVPPTRPWRYAVGMLGTSIPINMIKGSMILYYVDILGLDVRVYAAVMIVYAVIDAVDNPVLGYLSDRTRTRFGRRRPWLVIGAPLLAASMIAFFSAPDSLDGLGLVVWFAVFAVLCEAFDSMLNANYGALLPELFPDERKRSVTNSMRQGFQLVALVVSLAVTPLLTTSVFGSETTTTGFTTTAIIYGAVAVAAILFMAFGAKENPRYATEHRPRFFRTLLDIVKNPKFWSIGIAGACYGSAMALVLAGVQLYVRYSLGLPVANALFLQGTVILLSVAGLVFWTWVVRRRGAAFAWRIAFVLLAAGFVPLFFANDLVTAIAAGAFLGVGYSGMLATNDLIVARVLDDDARRHGQHREGLFLSAFGFFGRLNAIITGLSLAALGVFFGYNSGDDPGGDPGLAFRFYVCVFPFALCVVGAIIARLVRVPAPMAGPDAGADAGSGMHAGSDAGSDAGGDADGGSGADAGDPGAPASGPDAGR